MTSFLDSWIDSSIRFWKRYAHLLPLVFLLFATPLVARVPAQGNSEQILPIAGLRTWLGNAEDRVSVRGVVTRVGQDSFVQDATGGVLVHFARQPRIKVGDELEVIGLPRAMLYSARMEQATARVLWAAVPPPPVAITVGQAARGDFDNQFVELEARLDRLESHGNLLVLSLSDEQQSFSAILQTASGDFISPSLELHSMIRLRGICFMDASLTHNTVPFVILLRSAEDMEELAGPPWWTPQLLFRDFLILISLLLLSALVFLQVRSDRNRSIQQEREHIAHEMHDTLAQSFAGVAFQLHAVRSGLSVDSAQLAEHVDVAINMVRHSHQEARSSIAALKARSSGDSSLANDLLQSLQRMIGNGPIQVSIFLEGAPRVLPLSIGNALLRIGQEAGANAIHHSGTSTLVVRLIYLEQTVVLEVMDNGCGFDPDDVKQQGLGLIGMATRAQKLHGRLNIITEPERGTTISVLLPTRKQQIWQVWRKA